MSNRTNDLGENVLDLDLVEIPGGTAMTGTLPGEVPALADTYGLHPSWFDGEVPGASVDVPAFAISRTPVTNAQWAVYVAEGGGEAPGWWKGSVPPADKAEHPMTHVNLHDAWAFARWAGCRLPSAAEWERAGRGNARRTFPWGSSPVEDQAHFGAMGTEPVGSRPAGASPFGVLDLAGGVAEWCADQPDPSTALIKGGSWITENPAHLRIAAVAQSGWALNRTDYIGFRVARSTSGGNA